MFVLQDLRFGLRTLARAPGFALLAVATLALGVGANSAMFSVIDAVLLKGLPYRDPDGLVMVAQQIPTAPRVNFSSREFAEFQRRAGSLSPIAAWLGNGFTIARRDAEPHATFGLLATPNFFETLGVQPRLGRGFSSADERAVVLSDGLWREYFNGDPDAIGAPVTLNNEPYTVVGVMPKSFVSADSRYQLWVPASVSSGMFARFPNAHFLRVVGRVRPGATAAAVQADADSMTQWLAQTDPNARRRVYTMSLQTAMTGDFQRPLLILMGAVGALLLIACANVANLTLARAVSRTREFAVRAAIGAPRWRLIGQLTSESLLLGAAGGIAGLMLGTWGVAVLVRLSPAMLPFIQQARLDTRVLVFTMTVAIATSCLLGLAPAFSAARSDVFEAIRQSGRGLLGGGRRLRRTFVFAQVALATVLLAVAGLMIRSLAALESVPSGLRSDGVLTASMSMTEQAYPERAQMLSFYRRVLEAARGIPGVETAAIATHMPFTGQNWGNSYEVEGRPAPAGEQYVASVRPVSPGYFATLGIPLPLGRPFHDGDSESASPVAVVNEKFARRFWPNESPIGRRIQVDGPWRTIVGVASDIKPGRLDAAAEPEIYVPYEQLDSALVKFLGRGVTLVARSGSLDTASLAAGLRAAVRNADKAMPIRELRALPDLIAGTMDQSRFRARLLGVFAALALLLASVGIYGVISYSVTQRVQEIGVRVALGASGWNIVWMVVRDAAGLAAAGVAAGIAGALAAGRSLTTLLFGVKPGDPATLAVVASLLLGVALLAALIPARRASRVDAMTSLRAE